MMKSRQSLSKIKIVPYPTLTRQIKKLMQATSYLAWITMGFVIFSPNQTIAQRFDWMISLHVPPGFELYLEEFWHVDIFNHETEETQIFLFGAVFEEQQGEMFHGRSNVITLPPGGRSITPRDITKITERWINPEFKSVIDRSGRFPAGNYMICITVFLVENGQEVGHQCIPFMVTRPSAPRLIAPLDAKTTTETYPIFQWTDPIPLPREAAVYYRVKICEVYAGQTAYEAIDNITHFETLVSGSTTLQYPLAGLRFEDGKDYVWQVQALDEAGKPIGENDGKSEIWKFTFRTQPSLPVIPILPSAPDTLLIGGFRLVITQLTQTKDSLVSGQAEGQFLIAPPCADTTSAAIARDSSFCLIPIPGPMVYSAYSFTVDFTNLQVGHWPPQKAEKVIKGAIDQKFKTPMEIQLDDFILHIKRLILQPDSAKAEVVVELPASAIYPASGCAPITIGPETVGIDKHCSIYLDLPEFRADSLYIGNTGILACVRGAEIDFRGTTKKVVFTDGQTIPQKPTFPNNSAYLQADYSFSNAEVIGCGGLKANLTLNQPWDYNALLPLGFHLYLHSGSLKIEKSWIREGTFAGHAELPKAVVDQQKNKITVHFASAKVDSFLNLATTVPLDRESRICWGGFALASDSARLFLPGLAGEASLALIDTVASSTFSPLNTAQLDTAIRKLPGLTINLLHPEAPDTFFVHTPDAPRPLIFPQHKTQVQGWLNIATKGITGELKSKEMMKLLDARLGMPDSMGYKADSTFQASIWHQPDSLLWANWKFVRNAAYDSYLGGRLVIPYPCKFTAKYKNLETTSTAELVGGEVFFKDKELQYWGVKMTADTSGNILSVDTGEIIYMNSSIAEKVHFDKSFRIIWGEMLATGDLGKFIFDYNSAGQKFDGFPFTLHAASLSKYRPKKKSAALDTLGYLRAYGDVHFDFFGAKLMDIHDHKDSTKNHDQSPYWGRFVTLNKDSSNLHFVKNWGSNTANMVFDVFYDLEDQNGFQGVETKQPMQVTMQFLSTMSAGTLHPKTIDLNSLTSFIHFCCESKVEASSEELKLLQADFASINAISGIIQIKGDAIKRIVLEGHASLKAWKFEEHSVASLEVTPSNITLRNRAQISFTCYSVGLLGLASTSIVLDKTKHSLEGDITGVFQVYGGSNFVVNQSLYAELEARGRFNFYLSPTVNYLQGYGKIKAKFGVSLECEGAFFAGYKAPTDKIWALDQITRGPSIRDILVGQGRSELTGIYLAGSFSYSVNIIEIIEGRYTIWAGIGFFGPILADKGSVPDLSTTFLGHAGVELHGEILGGLVSASAWAELLTALTIDPLQPWDTSICMTGTLGLEACAVIWCVNWQGTIHIDDATGIGTGGCYGN